MEKETISIRAVRTFPKRRFSEFTDVYNTMNLSKVFSIFNGYAFSSSDAVKEGVRWVKIADVGINEMKINNLSFLPASFIHRYEKFCLKEGDYVVALTRPILNKQLKIAQIDEEFCGSLLNQRVGKLVSQNHLAYVYFLLQKSSLINRIENRIAGTDPPNLSISELKGIRIAVPSFSEQKKIASFLSAVDKKIQQLKRKKELLETFKKGVMQQLFSQEVRFKDEKGKDFPEWEKKQYGDIYTFLSTNSFSRNDLNYEKGSVKNIHYGDIHTKFPNLFHLSKENVPYINHDMNISKIPAENFCQEGDLVIADASENYKDIGKTIEIIDLNGENVLAGLHTFLARPGRNLMHTGFSGYLVQTWQFRKQVMTIAQGTKVLGLSTGRMKKLKLKIPSMPEQQKIADFLAAIDKKTEAVSQQIQKTQSFKKGLLQQMFV